MSDLRDTIAELESALRDAPLASDGGKWTTAEWASVRSVSDSTALRLMRKLARAGKVRPTMKTIETLHGTRKPVPAWELA